MTMSDNDLVKLGDAEEARDELVRVLNYINTYGTLDYADYCELFDTIERVFDALKAVPHEMSAKELLHAERRMYNEDSDAYLEYSSLVIEEEMESALCYIEAWALEHPEERSEK